MAKASRKHFGPGAHGKHDGSGAMTNLDDAKVRKNDILSNRDKAQHSQERGLDSKFVQVEEFKDTVANRRSEERNEEDDA